MTINSPGFNAHKRDLIFDFAHSGSLAVAETFISDENSFKALTSNKLVLPCFLFLCEWERCGCFLVYFQAI